MNKPQIFGLWREHCGEGFPSLQKEPQKILSLEDAEKVARYLEEYPVWVSSTGLVNSCMGDKAEIAGTLSIKTNGEWAWQDTMPYYVRRFRISPLSDFLRAIKGGNVAIPLEGEVDVESLEFPVF